MTTIKDLLDQKMTNFKNWVLEEVLKDKNDDMAQKIRDRIQSIPDDNVLRLALLDKLFGKFTVEEAISLYKTEIGYNNGYLDEYEDKFNRYIRCFYDLRNEAMNN